MIERFDGPHRFLSNFAASRVTLDGVEFDTVEHAYQAAKVDADMELGQSSLRLRFLMCRTPGDAKRLGRQMPIRKDWEQVKTGIMLQLLRQKFEREPMRSRLIATAPHALVEGNHWHDRFWGRCSCPRCGGSGENHLGRLLELVRGELSTSRQ